jgi:hypothetical protein
MNLQVTQDIVLKLFDESMAEPYYRAIHSPLAGVDQQRVVLKRKYDSLDKLRSRLKDAIENKFMKDGTPDFIICYKGQIAGVFVSRSSTHRD